MKKTIITLLIFINISVVFSQKIDTLKIHEYIDYIEKNNREIGSISIFKNGKEMYNRTFGHNNQVAQALTNQTSKLSLNNNNRYQIGSISKLVTAVLIFKLIEDKKLKLEDKLSKYFPNVPNSKKITIKHLLEHSSGLGDYVLKKDSIYWLQNKVHESEIMKEIINQGTLFKPGKKIKYSNSAYYLLTKIVEKEYNNEYAEIVDQIICKPLNLNHFFSIKKADNNTLPSLEYSNKWDKLNEFDFVNVIGVGDISSTSKDLNEFITHLFNGNIISKSSVEKMKPNINKETFGRGMMLIPYYNIIFYGHGGDTYGTHSLCAYNEKDSLALSICINGERYPHNDFALDLLNIIYNKPHKLPEFIEEKTIDYNEIKPYEGTYSSASFPLKLTVFIKDSLLHCQATNQPSFLLSKINKHQYCYTLANINIEFIPNENKLVFIQNGIKETLYKE